MSYFTTKTKRYISQYPYMVAFMFSATLLALGSIAYGYQFVQNRVLANQISDLQEERSLLTQEIDTISSGDEYLKYQAALAIVPQHTRIVWADTIRDLVDLYENIEEDTQRIITIHSFAITKEGELALEGSTDPAGPLAPIYRDRGGILSVFEQSESYADGIVNMTIPEFTRIEETAQDKESGRVKREGGYEFVLTASFVLNNDS